MSFKCRAPIFFFWCFLIFSPIIVSFFTSKFYTRGFLVEVIAYGKAVHAIPVLARTFSPEFGQLLSEGTNVVCALHARLGSQTHRYNYIRVCVCCTTCPFCIQCIEFGCIAFSLARVAYVETIIPTDLLHGQYSY